MERLGYILIYVIALLIVTLGGNLLAQRIYPTTQDDEGPRRFAYRLVVITCAGGIVLAVGVLASAFGL